MKNPTKNTLYRKALGDAFRKLDPRVQYRNPVMFLTWLGALLTEPAT